MVSFGFLASNGGKIGGHAGRKEVLIDFLETGFVCCWRLRDGKIETLSSIDLDIDEARGKYSILEVYDLIWDKVIAIES